MATRDSLREEDIIIASMQVAGRKIEMVCEQMKGIILTSITVTSFSGLYSMTGSKITMANSQDKLGL